MKSYHDYFPFESYNEFQEEAIQAIVSSFSQGKKYFILEAPTGIGKSAIAYTTGKYYLDNVRERITTFGPKIMICTKTKQLQLQYQRMKSDIFSIWSARNYKCAMSPDAEDAYYGCPICLKSDCPEIDNCEYPQVKKQFLRSRIAVTNYHYFLNFEMLQPRFLVLDEAHNLENLLCDMLTVLLSGRTLSFIYREAQKHDLTKLRPKEFEQECHRIFNIDCIDESAIEALENFGDILNTIAANAEPVAESFQEENREKDGSLFYDPDVKRFLRMYNLTQELIERITTLVLQHDRGAGWIISRSEDELIEFKPLTVTDASRVLFNRAEYLLFMSATICGAKYFSRILGIPEEEYTYLSVPSPFPVENRKVISVNCGSLNYRNKNELLPKMVRVMDSFIERIEESFGHSVRGIIHSVSYENAKTIKELSAYSDRMVIPTGDELLNIQETIKSSEDIIIVSPSIIEGVDLPGDLSRFQIFPKVPYDFLGDKWVKAKMEQDQGWYTRNAIIKIVQGCGRSIRNKDDWAYTLILDGNFRRLIGMNKDMFPTWFLQAVHFAKI